MSIYGHTLVDVAKEPEQLRWMVRASNGQDIVGVPWRIAFDQSEIEVIVRQPQFAPVGSTRRGTGSAARWYDADRLNALEVCLSIAPLEAEDLERLFRAYPLLQQRQVWRVDLRRRPWDAVPEPERPSASRSSAPTPKCSTPEDTEEVADPERKLLV